MFFKNILIFVLTSINYKPQATIKLLPIFLVSLYVPTPITMMKSVAILFASTLVILTIAFMPAKTGIYKFTMNDIGGQATPLSNYEGKVVVIVNTASKCGLTPQYADLEQFYKDHKDKGLVILGFPANNFLSQEPGTDDEIKSFCTKNYGVTFPMFSKISVKGKDIHPLYKYLTETTGENVAWNFQKFLVNKKGEVVASIPPKTKITDPEVVKQIEKLLAAQ